ncbi:hypothetical protein [Cellulomonas sp.]|uniref:hypothetical protein n=1 Tax=Cellulomonas sp. TaxID=40001 RepID=UPI001B20C6BE|nr:hypothetical protein [Cellulomonas sp.]MBO9556349.1 hypothetical protein [Cellulomonas sp.]
MFHRHRKHVHRFDAFMRSKGPAEVLYGAVVSGAVLAVTSAHVETGESVVLSTAVVAVTYWLAHVYAEAIGGRFEDKDHSTGHRLRHALQNNLGVLYGSAAPLLAFVVVRLFGEDVSTAAIRALLFTVVLLMGSAAVAAGKAGARGWKLVGETAVAGGFGLVVILLKIVQH